LLKIIAKVGVIMVKSAAVERINEIFQAMEIDGALTRLEYVM
jgi:hypothetical protein